MSPRFFSDQQQEDAKVIGVKTNAESQIIAGSGNQKVVVWDENADASQVPTVDEKGVAGTAIMFRKSVGRDPVFIRIQNLHATEPLRVSEDLRDANGAPLCNASNFTAVLASGSATDDGLGSTAEWQRNRPSCISIHATNAWRAVCIIRYAK